MQQRVKNGEFLEQLAELLKASDVQGSVYLEQKRLVTLDGEETAGEATSPFAVLFRATNGARDRAHRKKLSTIVAAPDLDLFWKGYVDVLKLGMGGLKRKEKKRKDKKVERDSACRN